MGERMQGFIPMKKKYRDIVVDGVKYAWMLRGYEFLTVWKDKKPVIQLQVRCTVTPKFVEDEIRRVVKVQESKEIFKHVKMTK